MIWRDDRPPAPGIVVEWARDDEGDWVARVVYVIDGTVIDGWQPAENLRPQE